MKKTLAVIGSAAALSFAGAGLAVADDAPTTTGPDQTETTQNENAENEGTEDGNTDGVETPAEVSEIAAQLCGTIEAYDFLGSAEGVVPGLSDEECEANADAAVAAALSGDIGGAIEILRGIDAGIPDDDEATDGSAAVLGSLTGGGADGGESEDVEPAALGS
ncbi:hypothetical protein [Dietzia sp. ANT_WB102]|uniref:hypothetical protein n=1 Tax=Dietzia sp. ANT_WB102 TaxID=2597345 RepID=UPI0011EE4796|nr:hypothetical protein [Dietzia sp. ANT_WB102]KAA0918222.1 hypothetical protein FQ137_02295 [Dietzia sp. ANT_WB102]